MKITGTTRLNRRAKEIFKKDFWRGLNGVFPITDEQRELTVASLEQIAAVATLAAKAIETRSSSVKISYFDEDGDKAYWLTFPDRADGSLYVRAGNGRIRLSHAGMAVAHDLFEVAGLMGAKFPPLEELGYKNR